MSKVLVVSRNPAMAMGLSATDYEVNDLRPSAFGDWISSAAEADALILDLESPALAAAAVVRLRKCGKLAPVLLVSSDRPGWTDPQMTELDASAVLPLPITRPALLEALEGLISAQWASTAEGDPTENNPDEPFLPAESPAVEPSVFRTAEVLAGLRNESDPLMGLADESQIPPPLPPPRHDPVVAEEIQVAEVRGPATPPRQILLPPEPTEAVPALSAVPRTRRSTALPSRRATSHVLDDLDRLRVTSPEPPAPGPATPVTRTSRRARRPEQPAAVDMAVPKDSPREPGPQAPGPASLVRALLAAADELYGVPETAEVAVADAVERTTADAGALLIPDDGHWRVSAGLGLRPLEHRYELVAASWLIQQVVRGNKGVIVEDSDIAREQLQGAPLASWRHLLAAPVPGVDGLFILARRDDPAFTEDDLATLAVIGTEACDLLAAALEARALARRLWEFRDEQDLPR